MEIKLVLTDIDGVWTDGGMYYDQFNNELKKFNTSDSAGVILLHEAGIETGIITGETTEIVKRRAQKLNISILKMGIRKKIDALMEISESKKIPLHNIAYIGDDLIDIPVLKKVGFSAVPQNAANYVAQYATMILSRKGGDGAFREFAEVILKKMNLLDQSIDKWLEKII
jgi:3-deoxy-D-glycero-D-galacto-nononate 9-phosphatase